MKPLTYYIDRCIIAVYAAALVGGIFSCTLVNADAASENRRLVNIRYVASTSDNLDYMTADDFLQGSEKAANHEDITRYLENLKRNGLYDEAAAEEAEAAEAAEEEEEPVASMYGDANCDKKVNVADAVAILQYIANKTKYPLSEVGALNADVDGQKGITGSDAVVIQQVDASIVDQKDLPLKK